jgi:hypothetical protein
VAISEVTATETTGKNNQYDDDTIHRSGNEKSRQREQEKE